MGKKPILFVIDAVHPLAAIPINVYEFPAPGLTVTEFATDPPGKLGTGNQVYDKAPFPVNCTVFPGQTEGEEGTIFTVGSGITTMVLLVIPRHAVPE